MLEPERVAYLVGNHEFDKAAHQLVGQWQLLGARIERSHLHEIPVASEVHDVVKHLNVGIENLARSRIGDVRPHGVLDG